MKRLSSPSEGANSRDVIDQQEKSNVIRMDLKITNGIMLSLKYEHYSASELEIICRSLRFLPVGSSGNKNHLKH